MSAIDADIVAEARRLLDRASAEGIPLRLLGGVAIHLRAVGETPAAFTRDFADLDFVTARRSSAEIQRFMRADGYAPHVSFNALHGHDRLLFFDEEHDRQVDIFVGAFRMSHRIPLDSRLEVDPISVPLAELLLTKLQIAELNEKDVRDTLALLHGHQVGDEDGDVVNLGRVAELCSADWGLWRTITANLSTCQALAGSYDAPDATRLDERFGAILERIEAAPKTRAWKLRAKIGDRKRWYELPEEVAGGP